MDNANFKRDQKNVSKKAEGRIEHVDKIAGTKMIDHLNVINGKCE